MRSRVGKHPLAIVDAPPVTPPPPLRSLGPTGLGLWSRIQAEYLIADCAGLEILQQLCEAADLVQVLAEAVAREGVTLPTQNGGVRAHPALRDMLSNRAFVVNTLRRLGITDEPIGRIGRPSGPHWSGNAD
jgi:hypothetical protein